MKDRDLTPVLVWIPLVTQEFACEFPVSTKQVVYAGARDQKITAWSVDWSPPQGLTVHKGHDVVQKPFGVAGVQKGKNVGVGEASGDFDFA